MRWHRDEYISYMTFGPAPRPMFVELFGPLIGLEDEWRQQGASDDEIAMTAFDWDYIDSAWVAGSCGRLDAWRRVRHETDTTIEYEDDLGRTLHLSKGMSTLPLPVNWPVRSMDDWLKIKPRYQFEERRIDWTQLKQARQAQQQGALVKASIPGAFDEPRQLMGEAELCMAYYDQPELVHDILQTLTRTALEVLQRVSEKVTIDQLHVHEDLAGKSGPMLGPTQVEQFAKPYFRPVWDLLSSRGTKIFRLDTDGNCEAIIAPLLDAGVTEIYPMEPAAGMDVVKLRAQYGERLAMSGGIDKHVLRGTREDIRAELEYKMQPHMRTGMMFGLDHRIPNGTPLENYRYYVDLGREILGLPPRGAEPGWVRMAG